MTLESGEAEMVWWRRDCQHCVGLDDGLGGGHKGLDKRENSSIGIGGRHDGGLDLGGQGPVAAGREHQEDGGC